MSIRVPVLTVALLLTVTACTGTPAAPPEPQADARVPGPTRVEAGVPVGYPQTAEGAQAAALRYVAVLGGPLMLDPARRDLALAAVSPGGQPVPGVVARWASRPNVERVTGAEQALRSGGPVVAAAAPVMSRVTAYDGATARVAIWATAVLGTDRLGTLDQSWSTETVTLRWVGDWKLAAYESSPGPVPALRQAVTPLPAALSATVGMTGTFDVAR
jgi:hypothetical protein